MRVAIAPAFAMGLGLVVASAAHAQPHKWDLFCRYDNGSIAFTVNYAEHKASGDMVSDQLAIGDGKIVFDVSASRSTLLKDFHVVIDRKSHKWTTDKPGYGGTCGRS